jgi:hypothetical protein
LHGTFQKIAKKYRELKAETRRASQPPPPEMPPPATYYQTITQVPPPPAPEIKPEPELPPQSTPAVVSAPVAPEPPSATEIQPPAPEASGTAPPETAPPEQEISPAPVAAAPPPAQPEPPVLKPTTEGLDVEKLFAILNQNYTAAQETYQDKVLKVKGQVLRTVISDAIDVNYLLLTSDKDFGAKQISCTLSKTREESLTRLREGETVTVEGTMKIKYDGTRFSILMKDCTLLE